MSATESRAKTIQSVDRAAALIKAIADSPHSPTVNELATSCGLNRSTTWRLLATLDAHGLIERDPISQRYSLGYAFLRIAAGADVDPLVRRGRPVLEELARETGETTNLAVARRFSLVYVDQVDPPHVMAPNWLDKPLPLHATSGGKAFLAWLGPDERDAILPEELPRYTSRTITRRSQLERELEEVRRVGYALCASEYEEFSSGASAAVLNSRGYPMAVVNVWGPTPRNPVRKLHKMGRETVKTAEEIAKLLD